MLSGMGPTPCARSLARLRSLRAAYHRRSNRPVHRCRPCPTGAGSCPGASVGGRHVRVAGAAGRRCARPGSGDSAGHPPSRRPTRPRNSGHAPTRSASAAPKRVRRARGHRPSRPRAGRHRHGGRPGRGRAGHRNGRAGTAAHDPARDPAPGARRPRRRRPRRRSRDTRALAEGGRHLGDPAVRPHPRPRTPTAARRLGGRPGRARRTRRAARVETAGTVPDGARFETYAYADRLLGLELTRDIGRRTSS